MLDHISLNVSDYARTKAFYLAALQPLGIQLLMDHPEISGGAIGTGETLDIWIQGDMNAVPPVHICFAATSREQVEQFHAAALAAGGTDNGAPGVREQYAPNYYAAFVIDPDGNNLEVLYREPTQ